MRQGLRGLWARICSSPRALMRTLAKKRGGVFAFAAAAAAVALFLVVAVWTSAVLWGSGGSKARYPPVEAVRRVGAWAGREAYVTMSGPGYVIGTKLLWFSLKQAGATRSLVVLVPRGDSKKHKAALAELIMFSRFVDGVQVRPVDVVPNPDPKGFARFRDVYTKLRVWQLTEFTRVVFIDSDVIVRKNMDELFQMPDVDALIAAPDIGWKAPDSLPLRVNTGVLVVKPSKARFKKMMADIASVESYDGGDQGFLIRHYGMNQFVLPMHYNVLRRVEQSMPELFDLKLARAVHYVGTKPWDRAGDYKGEPQCLQLYYDTRRQFKQKYAVLDK